jgi:hypothetical protein
MLKFEKKTILEVQKFRNYEIHKAPESMINITSEKVWEIVLKSEEIMKVWEYEELWESVL